jgi:hypothetical protein
MPRIKIELPTSSGRRTGVVWKVDSVDTSKKDGHAFVGSFLREQQYDFDVGTVIVMKVPEGSVKRGYHSGVAYRLTEGGELEKFASADDWRGDFLDFRDSVAAEINKSAHEENNPLADFSDEQIYAEAKRRGIV